MFWFYSLGFVFVILGRVHSQIIGDEFLNENLDNLVPSYGEILENFTDLIGGNFPVNNFNLFNDYQKVLEIWSDIQKFISEYRGHVDDNDCYRQLNVLFSPDALKENWTLQMLDASAKPQSGILYGNLVHMGNYAECLAINDKAQGKYCTIPLILKNRSEIMQNLQLSFGVCMPATCNSTHIQPLIDDLENKINFTDHFVMMDAYCSTSTPEPFTGGNIFGITLFAFFGFLLVFGTLYDFVNRSPKKSTTEQVILAFSMYTNGKKMFTSKTSEGALGCLNGLRVISMIWIVAGHEYMFTSIAPATNALQFMEFIDHWSAFIILTTSMAVDTFFMISGFLLVYIFMKNHDKHRKIPWHMFYIHRYLRLTPSLIMVIILTATVYERMGSGPLWFAVGENIVGNCKDTWWNTMLYIQNYYDPRKICVPQTWYLAVDTQLYFLAPIIFFFLVRWPRVTLSSLTVIGLGSCANNFAQTWVNLYVAAFFDEQDDQFDKMYVPTHTRCGPWIVGALFGYFLHKLRGRKVNLRKITATILWLISVGTIVGIFAYHKILAKAMMDQTLTMFEIKIHSSFYNGFLRSIWALALGGIIFLCLQGYGGVMNKILSWSVFNVLIRLNYNMYLLHMLVLIYFYGQKQTPDFVAHKYQLQELGGNVMLTFLVSIIWTLAFESPILILEKLMFMKQKVPPLEVHPAKPEGIINGSYKNTESHI